MSSKSYLFSLCLITGLWSEAKALECWGRVGYYQDKYSNKCMTCEKVNYRNPGQPNCKFQNTDHCCESHTCNENNPNFMDWVNEKCEIPL